MPDCEELIALQRVKAFLPGFVNDDPERKDSISLGLCFVHLDKQKQEDLKDNNIVESTDSMSGFSVDSKADRAEVEDEEVVEFSEAMSDSDCCVESDADERNNPNQCGFPATANCGQNRELDHATILAGATIRTVAIISPRKDKQFFF